jgi:MFS transporter, MHS family, alpha-ketoglutarate permease
MSLPSSVCAVVFGGTAPYLKSWAFLQGHPAWFTLYFAGLCIVALIAVRFLPETKGRDLLES